MYRAQYREDAFTTDLFSIQTVGNDFTFQSYNFMSVKILFKFSRVKNLQ